MNERNVFTVYSLKLMNWLCFRGFEVIGVYDNPKDAYFKVFLFQDSEQLRLAVEQYLKTRQD